MKQGAINCVKFNRLKFGLKLPQWQVVGLLESIWLFTSKNAQQGDVGRFTDEDIAYAIEWHDEPAKLIEILVSCGWLDRDKKHRLLVHDWADHCPTYVKGNIVRSGSAFATKKPTKSATKDTTKRPTKSATKEPTKDTTKKPTKSGSREPTTMNHDLDQALSLEYKGESEGEIKGMVQGMNFIILHKPEQAKKVKLESFDDFVTADVTSLACTICDEFTGPGVGAFSRWLKAFAVRSGDVSATNSARDLLFEFWSELKAGEEPNSRCAALLARCRKIFDERTKGRK